MAATIDMFSPTGIKPRRHSRVMMHVDDAGQGNCGKVIKFECYKCGHNTGWIADEKSISENKKGMPCPVCNIGESCQEI
jgi:hypothetical protein